MKRLKLALLALLFGALGCTDNIDSVTREYRATINESIDALSMITNEDHADRMTVRVFRPMNTRFKAIDDKLVIVKSNRDNYEFAKEVLESDGTHLYLTDLQVNRQRYALEITRLRKVYQDYQDRERELLLAEGNANPQFPPEVVCPALHELLHGNILEGLRSQLTRSNLVTLMSQFPQWKVKDYEGIFARHEKRRASFVPQREIRLVW